MLLLTYIARRRHRLISGLVAPVRPLGQLRFQSLSYLCVSEAGAVSFTCRYLHVCLGLWQY
jgi:hypothetical protein